MNSKNAVLSSRLFRRKSVETLQREAGEYGLKRVLGPAQLVLLGIGCIIGAGIYVLTGAAAAQFAGPAVLLSFIIAGCAAGLTALCYAELASTLPVSGSSYTYCYASIGELFAWIVGWLLLLEYGVATSLLAVGFSGYLVSLLADLGIVVPPEFSTPLVLATMVDGRMAFHVTGGFNLVAAVAVLAVAGVLVRGISQSASVNQVLVILKVIVLVTFVAVAASAVDPQNWTPFIPANEGGFTFGWPGVLRAASMLFFAYIGFESVSAAASEARNPQRDMPLGILGALVACTVLYLAVAAVLTGVVSYKELGVANPLAVALDQVQASFLGPLIKLGAVGGLASVLLVNSYVPTRIGFAMSRDGLLPPLFSRLHPRFATPYIGTMLFGVVFAACAALLPLSILGDLISFGTSMAFSIVCLSVIWLRNTRPDVPRPFRVPLGGFHVRGIWIGYVPAAAMLLCWLMVVPAAIDIGSQAARGDIIPASILFGHAVIGTIIYLSYGLHRATG